MVSSGVGPGGGGSMHGHPSEGPTTNDITNPKKYKVPYPQKNSSLKTQTSQNKSIEMQLFPDKRDFAKAERHSSEQPHPASNFDNISPTKTSLEDDAPPELQVGKKHIGSRFEHYMNQYQENADILP